MRDEDKKRKLKELLLERFPEFEGELNIRVDTSDYRTSFPTYVSAFSSVGGLGTKVRWLNKVTVEYSSYQKRYRVLKHVARTDKRFLSPFDERFCEVVNEVTKEVYA